MAPWPKRPLAQFYRAVRRRIREWRIRRAVHALRGIALSRDEVMPLVARLREAWGNTSYSADLGYLDELVERALYSRGPFLECGSGLSTVVLGVLAQRTGADVWSLEQDQEWAIAVGRRLTALGLGHVRLVHAPLEATPDGQAWYAFNHHSLPRNFAAVFCDGPAVRRSLWPPAVHLAWRSPVVSELRKRKITFGEIILDDHEDRRCEHLMATWRRAGLLTEVVVTPFGRHVVAIWPSTESRPNTSSPV